MRLAYRSRFVPAFAVLLVLSLPAAAQAPTSLEAFAGAWVWSGSASEDAARVEAIDTTIGSMSAIMRPFARKRMHKSIQTARSLDIGVQGQVVHVGWDGRAPESLPIDGLERPKHSADGKTAQVAARVSGRTLTTTWRRDDSDGRNEYRLSPDGTSLTLERTIDSKYFSVPVRFAATYRRP